MNTTILQPIFITTEQKRIKNNDMARNRKITFRISKEKLNIINNEMARLNLTPAEYFDFILNDFRKIIYKKESTEYPLGYTRYLKDLISELMEVDEIGKTELISFRVRKDTFEQLIISFDTDAKTMRKLISHIVLYKTQEIQMR